MISARSRQLLSNGSSLTILCLILLLGACSTTQSSTRRPSGSKVIKPNKPTTEKETESESGKVLSMDTVRWIEVSPEAYPPITSAPVEKAELDMVKKSVYHVALLLPLRLDNYDITDLSANNAKFASFYSGLKLAAESLDTDTRIRISTYETDRSADKINSIINSWSGDMPDVIVGPYETSGLRRVAAYAKDNGIALISPWRASTSVTSDNLYYLQMRPNVTAYYDAILSDIQSKHNRENLAIIKNKNGAHDNIVKYIQDANQKNSSLPLSEALTEIPISMDTLLQSDSLVFDRMLSEGVDVFFMPQFNSARDEDFVYGCLRKLNAEKGNRDITVYLMPMALNNERIDLSILKNLDLRICEYKFPDKRNPDLKAFNRKYYDTYGRLPNGDSYFGMDFMRFVAYGLENNGQYFHYYMKDQTYDLSQMSIHITPYYNSDDELLYLMNNSFYFIEFKEDRFVPETKG